MGSPAPCLQLSTSVVLFVHIFKAGGTTNRKLFQDWADGCGKGDAFIQAGSCISHWTALPWNNSKYICLDANGVPMHLEEQGTIIRSRSVVAGHIRYGFDRFIPNKNPVYITCLRSPVSRLISAITYVHSREWIHLKRDAVVKKIDEIIHNKPDRPSMTMFRYLILPDKQLTPTDVVAESIAHLQSDFAVVGLLEHYHVFVELVANTLDPYRLQDKLWINATSKALNVHQGSFMGTSSILPLLSNASTEKMHRITSNERMVYDVGCRVTMAQCNNAVTRGINTTSRLRLADCDAVRRWCTMKRKRSPTDP